MTPPLRAFSSGSTIDADHQVLRAWFIDAEQPNRRMDLPSIPVENAPDPLSPPDATGLRVATNVPDPFSSPVRITRRISGSLKAVRLHPHVRSFP